MLVNKYELEKQRKEEILKGEYARVEIIIPRVTTEDKCFSPIHEVDIHNGNIIMIALLMDALDSAKENLLKEYPETALAKLVFSTKNKKSEHIKPGDVIECDDSIKS